MLVYDLMMGNDKIGVFKIDETVLGNKYYLKVDGDCEADYKLAQIAFLTTNNELDDEKVRIWMSRRVMPRNRDNVEEVLAKIGLTEYNVFEIFKHNNGACRKDYVWVKFDETKRYEDVNPFYAEKILAIIERDKKELPPNPFKTLFDNRRNGYVAK